MLRMSSYMSRGQKLIEAGKTPDAMRLVTRGFQHYAERVLGIDISETIDEGNTLGASFAKGFSEGFDFDAVASKLWDGLGSVVSKASKLLPGGESADLSSVLSAALLMKIATPLVGMGKGAASLGNHKPCNLCSRMS